MTERDESRPLTAKGRATRERILTVAAELFYERGIGGTSNEQLRSTAGVSGSQLNHYFPTRAALVDAVLDLRVADAVDPARFPTSGLPRSLDTLRGWADTYVQRYETLTGGCKVGSLAGELLKTSPELREHIERAFEQWRHVLRDGLLEMKANGELVDSADADNLSLVLLSALQGGLLLTQASGSTVALRAALDGAIQVVCDHTATSDKRSRAPGPLT